MKSVDFLSLELAKRNKSLIFSWLVIVVLLVFLLGGTVYAVSQPKGRVRCSDFGWYNDALRAHSGGATWLDRDNDGIPCEALYYRDNQTHYGK